MPLLIVYKKNICTVSNVLKMVLLADNTVLLLLNAVENELKVFKNSLTITDVC